LTKLTVALFTALSEFDVVVWEALPMDHEESFDLATRGSVGWKLKAMSGDIGRFLAAYLTQTFSMCLLLVVLILTFGAWKLDQFVRGFFILFVLSIATIPQRLIIPFLLVWVVIHAFRYVGFWQFVALGGLCGLFVFMTLPNPEDAVWSFRWRGFGSMNKGDWEAAGGLIFSGSIGGWAVARVSRCPRVGRLGWHIPRP
jgi:hypothetical protein